jgi:predicted lysophospholipase L1 biosynthesis ABC-type transport system permease subunit
MKAGFYGAYAWRSLARGGQRTVFAIFCVAVGVLAIVALQLVGAMFNDTITGNIRDLNGGDLAVHIEGGLGGITQAQLSYFDQLKAKGSITAYTPVAVDGADAGTTNGLERFGIFAVDPAHFPLDGAPQFIQPANESMNSLINGNTVVLTNALAQQLGVGVGDTITFTTDEGITTTVTVGGIVADTGVLLQPLMLISLKSYAALPGLSQSPVTYTWVYVDVPGHSDAAASAIGAQIRRQLPLVTTRTAEQNLQDYQNQIQAIRNFLQAIGLLALLIGGVGIIHTMQVLLRRRQLEIAMLKTQGYRPRALATIFGLEASVIGLAGGVLGAGLGIGISFVVKNLVERAIFITLPTTIDPAIVGSGILIGWCTTLIFGLLPIIQASQVRPIVVLREVQARGGCRSALASGMLLCLLAFLFFLLALSILRNLLVAIAVVGGAGILLFLLTLAFSGLAWSVSRFPVLESYRWWYLVLIGLALLISAGITRISPGFGLPLLMLAAFGLVIVAMPRLWKANIRMALRNIGRQRVRSATTLVALFIGVFASGLGFTLGQGLKDSISNLLDNGTHYNAFVVTTPRDKSAVDQQLAHASDLTQELVTIAIPDKLEAVNGIPLQQILQDGSSGGTGSPGSGQPNSDIAQSGLNGYNLAAGDTPSITIQQGFQDSHSGRNLTRQDAGTLNALFPITDSEPPLRLKLGDSGTYSNANHTSSITLHVAGFYINGDFVGLNPVLVDQRVVTTLGGNNLLYIYSLHLNPSNANQTLQQIHTAAPETITISLAQQLQSAINSLLDNIVVLIEAIASLALIAAIIMIANAVALAMLERRREIGILKAIGHTSRSVLSIVLLENAAIGIAGSFLAMLLVTLITAVAGKLIFAKIWSFTGLAPLLILGIIAATAAVCMLVAAGVSWQASRVRPLDVLRYE